MGWIIALIVIVLIVVWLVAIYNQLVRKRTMKDEAWSGVDVQLKRRYDLIPNLVETVKGFAGQEEKVFTQVTEMRTRAMGATGVADKAAAENQLNQTLKSLFAVAERTPSSSPIRTSWTFRPSWPTSRTRFRWPAATTTARCATTTSCARRFLPSSSRTCSGSTRRSSSSWGERRARHPQGVVRQVVHS